MNKRLHHPRFSMLRGRLPGAVPGDSVPGSESSIFLRPSPLWSRALLWVLSGGATLTLVWSCFATYESTSVFPGELQTVRGEIQLKAAEDGLITLSRTGSHQFFRRGDVIVALSAAEQSAQIAALTSRLALLGALERSIEAAFLVKQRQIQRRIRVTSDLIARFEMLRGVGAIPEIQLLERQAELEEAKASLESFAEEKTMNLHSAAMEKNAVEAQLQQLQRSLPRLVLRAPSDGTLQNGPHRNVGERVQAGEVLTTFVAADPLQAVVKVPSRLSRPLALAEPVELSVDAFPAADYGYLEARIQSISPTSLQDREPQGAPSFSATITIQTPLPAASKIALADLRSGMAVQARITTGRRPVINMVFDFLNGLIKPMGELR